MSKGGFLVAALLACLVRGKFDILFSFVMNSCVSRAKVVVPFGRDLHLCVPYETSIVCGYHRPFFASDVSMVSCRTVV